MIDGVSYADPARAPPSGGGCGEIDALLFGDNDDKDNLDKWRGSDTCIPRESRDAASTRHFEAAL